MEPVSHYYYSHRLKLSFWDWGKESKPSMILVHGGLDHARNWDWVARELRDDYHVYALDLRGHGNSAWAPGALYSIAEHVLDLSALVDIVNDFPIYLIGHSLGGMIVMQYAGVYPERVRKVINIEGFGPPLNHQVFQAPSERLRTWIQKMRETEHREPRTYPNLAAAVSRMKEANPHLSDKVAEHLTLHGTNWNADGSLIWKFDNYARPFGPYGYNREDVREILEKISCPVQLFRGLESWSGDPEADGRAAGIRNCRVVAVPRAGHWLHHDQLDIFLSEARKFLAEP